ncbi:MULTISPECIES: glycoside hydrolase family 3 N-terminal domain-containing protein [Mycolicibacterium]|uniref:beta-N-acetylhexosaminidase n=1 Tax=Mycolicibacterium senegalense TaxID=1796 RepID=A0ABR5FX79_9MYCO|nr:MULTISPECIES: glycoside hydrolase family 3 N-terminal domain-containing protein [Mycolicibacterium]KLI06606.1 beta-glucosidase [Mycolicibacterium senegalense]KLO52566.1 beta-glucosidase [Mycolicibacterium senegalense]OBK06371.1 beta-glucosidase [Mycolicibacterium conceptionense]OMB86481.1 beta-glucosidase [Mycolicibacterium conceptionense]OMB88733.1 beta-glucosidase [Mycolicibacterium conceptionense]
MASPRLVATFAALSGLLLACSPSTPAPEPQSSDTKPLSTHAPMPAAPVCDVAALSPRDKLAQLLTVGVKDAADARSVVSEQHVGGIMIGSWTDLSMLSDGSLPDISAAGPVPLAVTVDEEGGRVSRLASLIGEQPSARVLAQTKSVDEVYGIALERGTKMRGLGITVDFAPVVDVTSDPDDTVIGDRSFGDDPAKVTEYAGAYARGLRDAGVLPVLKHFPGHGHGSGDSHTAGVVTTPPLAELQNNDLVPYRTLTTQAPVAVMVGHLEVPGLTGSDPASLSPAAYDLLRSGNYGGPGFNGVIYTDDLSSMAAINQRYGVAAAVLKALQAGADNALWITTDEVPAVLDGLEKALADGQLNQAAVDAAVQRNVDAKGGVHC